MSIRNRNKGLRVRIEKKLNTYKRATPTRFQLENVLPPTFSSRKCLPLRFLNYKTFGPTRFLSLSL